MNSTLQAFTQRNCINAHMVIHIPMLFTRDFEPSMCVYGQLKIQEGRKYKLLHTDYLFSTLGPMNPEAIILAKNMNSELCHLPEA